MCPKLTSMMPPLFVARFITDCCSGGIGKSILMIVSRPISAGRFIPMPRMLLTISERRTKWRNETRMTCWYNPPWYNRTRMLTTVIINSRWTGMVCSTTTTFVSMSHLYLSRAAQGDDDAPVKFEVPTTRSTCMIKSNLEIARLFCHVRKKDTTRDTMVLDYSNLIILPWFWRDSVLVLVRPKLAKFKSNEFKWEAVIIRIVWCSSWVNTGLASACLL